MDRATWAGLILSMAVMIVAVVVGGGRFSSFWDTASICMVFGGTIGAVLVALPWSQMRKTPGVLGKAFRDRRPDFRTTIDLIVSLADTARRDGILALEKNIDSLTDPFLRQGVQLIVDGTKPEIVEDILRTDNDALALRHKEGKAILDQLGRFGPAFGMIGTLVGLIIMLGQMSDPSKIGAGMAVALITTLYGTVLSNVAFLPLADKLGALTRSELVAREIVIRGITAIQSGESPRVIQRKLAAFLPPHQRGNV